jgi:F-type H+-transporting ATPase subunit epsilon
MPTLRLEIVTPDHRAYSDDVDMVVIPGVEGEMGVLPMHVPLMTQIHPGELVVTKEHRLFISPSGKDSSK